MPAFTRTGTLRESNILGIRGKIEKKDLEMVMIDSDEDEVETALQNVREIPLEDYLKPEKVEIVRTATIKRKKEEEKKGRGKKSKADHRS